MHQIIHLISSLRRRQMGWFTLAVVLLVMIILFTIGMIQNQEAANSAQLENLDLQEKQKLLTQENSDIKLKIENVGSDGHIRSRAKEEFGYMQPGEIQFVITNPGALENYTEEEWRIIAEEMAWDGR